MAKLAENVPWCLEGLYDFLRFHAAGLCDESCPMCADKLGSKSGKLGEQHTSDSTPNPSGIGKDTPEDLGSVSDKSDDLSSETYLALSRLLGGSA